MKTNKTHPFGRLIKRHLQQGDQLTQTSLADGIGVTPDVLTRMCNGERLTNRSRILDIIRWFCRQGIIQREAEATALLEAAGHARLNASTPGELGFSLAASDERMSGGGEDDFFVVTIDATIEQGILNFHKPGVAMIQGFDLWFSSFAKGRWQVWRLDTQARRLQPIKFALPAKWTDLDQFVPPVSAHHAKIAFAMNTQQGAEIYKRDLYLANLNGTNVRKLTSLPLDTYHPSWLPEQDTLDKAQNHDTITYHVEVDERTSDQYKQYGIWVTNIITGQSRQLTCGRDYDPVWSPNGRYIAYHSMEPTWCLKILEYAPSPHARERCFGWIAADLGCKATSIAWINNHEILFAAEMEGKWDLYKLPVVPGKTLTNPEKLTNNSWPNMYPAVFASRLVLWQAYPHEAKASDGPQTDKLAELFVMDLKQGIETPLITGIGNIRDGFLVRRTDHYLRHI